MKTCQFHLKQQSPILPKILRIPAKNAISKICTFGLKDWHSLGVLGYPINWTSQGRGPWTPTPSSIHGKIWCCKLDPMLVEYTPSRGLSLASMTPWWQLPGWKIKLPNANAHCKHSWGEKKAMWFALKALWLEQDMTKEGSHLVGKGAQQCNSSPTASPRLQPQCTQSCPAQSKYNCLTWKNCRQTVGGLKSNTKAQISFKIKTQNQEYPQCFLIQHNALEKSEKYSWRTPFPYKSLQKVGNLGWMVNEPPPPGRSLPFKDGWAGADPFWDKNLLVHK